jgi:hypothetical protein
MGVHTKFGLKELPGRPRQEDNTEMDLRGIWCVDINWLG